MIIDYFDNDDNWAPFNRIAHEWVGTPFHHMSILKHRGADCTTFIGGMLLEAQIIKKVEYDFYPPDWYAINPNLLLETVENNLKKNLIEGLSVEVVENIKDIKRGDLLAIWTVKQEIANHSAVYLGDDEVIHCKAGKGVEIRPFFKSAFEVRLKNIFRIKQEV